MANETIVPEIKRRGRPKKEVSEIKEEKVATLQEGLEMASVKQGEYNVEIIRDYYGNVDPFYLSKKDPDYAYRFLRDEHKNLSIKTGNLLFQKGGWQICPREHLLKLGLKESEISPDGMLRRGDTILAFMPKKLYEEKNVYKREQANRPMDAIKRLIKEGDSSQGGKDIHETMKGIQTAKDLGMKS
jgi:hypothetical protein